MKICIISPLYDPSSLGGRERYITTLVSELTKNYEVVVLTTKSFVNEKNKEKFKEKIIEINPKNIGTPYEMLTEPSTKITFKKLLWHLFDIWNTATYFQIKKAIIAEKPDLVFINGIRGLSSSVFSAINYSKIPAVYIMHDFELLSRWSGLYRNGKIIEKFNFFDKLYLNYMRKKTSKLSTVISPSKFLMDYHLQNKFFKNSKRFVVPNGTILKDDSKIREGSATEFLFLGQIVEHKGPQIAIEAIKKIKSRDVKLHVIGRGSYLDKLKKIIGHDDRIIIHGFVKDEDLPKIFDKCSYAIFPSIWYENYPLVIYEVMSKGIPVIASDIGGIPEMVQDNFNGFLFSPGNVNSLAEIITKVIGDKNILLPLSKNSISTSKKFNLEFQINSIREIIDKTVQARI